MSSKVQRLSQKKGLDIVKLKIPSPYQAQLNQKIRFDFNVLMTFFPYVIRSVPLKILTENLLIYFDIFRINISIPKDKFTHGTPVKMPCCRDKITESPFKNHQI